jgi:hypothetical protein
MRARLVAMAVEVGPVGAGAAFPAQVATTDQ